MTIPRALSYRSARSGVTLPRRSVRQNTARDGPEQRETHFRESPSHNQYHRPTGIISQRPAVWRRPGGCRHEQAGQGVGLSRYHRRLGSNTGAGDGRRAGGLSARRPMAAKGPRPSLVRCSGQLAASQGDQRLASRRRRTLWYRLGVGGHLPRARPLPIWRNRRWRCCGFSALALGLWLGPRLWRAGHHRDWPPPTTPLIVAAPPAPGCRHESALHHAG